MTTDVVAVPTMPGVPAPARTPKPPESRARDFVGGIVYTLLGNYVLRFVNLAITVVVARAAGPSGMGLVAAALLTIELIDTVRDFGLREALIYQPDLDAGFFSAAFLVIQSVSLLQAVVMIAVALIGPAFGVAEQMPAMLLSLALIFPLGALGSPHEAMLLRQGRFARRALADLIGVAVKAAVTIPLVVMGWTVWALIVGMLVSVAVRTGFLWLGTDWLPRLARPSRKALQALAGYGKHIVLVNIMGLARMKIDQYLIAALLLPAALGTYFLAARIPEIAIFGVNVAITTVVFPTFSRIASETGNLRPAYQRTLRAEMLLMAPVSVGIWATAPLIVEALFGGEWRSAAPVLALLALSGIPQTLGWSSGDVFKATGRPELLTAVTLIELLFSVPVLVTVILLTHDLALIATAMLACQTIGCLVRLGYMERHYGAGLADTLAGMLPILVASALMGAVVVAGSSLTDQLNPVLRLTFAVALGAVSYAALIALADRDSVAELRLLLKRTPPPGAEE